MYHDFRYEEDHLTDISDHVVGQAGHVAQDGQQGRREPSEQISNFKELNSKQNFSNRSDHEQYTGYGAFKNKRPSTKLLNMREGTH